MGIEELLGISDERTREVARRRWGEWSVSEPALSRVPDPEHLKWWTRRHEPELVNGVLTALARLAAVDGADDTDAALVLAWLMMPAVVRVARELGWVREGVDQALAAQLWIEVRTVPWRARQRVAPRILWRVREAVRRDLAVAFRGYLPEVPLAEVPPAVGAPVDVPPAEEWVDVLDWARADGVISEGDRGLLECAVETIRRLDAVGDSPRSNYAQGLGGDKVMRAIAAQLGVHPRTARRRTARVLAVLASNANRYLNSVAA